MLRRSIRHLGAAALVVSYLLWPPVTGTASPSAASRVEVGEPWRGKPGITETVAEIMARERRRGRDRGEIEVAIPHLRPSIEKEPSRPGAETGTVPPGPAVAVLPTVGTSFLATTIGEAGSIPPDTMGSVGPTQILVHTNGRVKLFDKDGTPDPALNVSDDTFWSSVSNGEFVSDPHVEYDRLSERWFLTIINVPLDVLGDPDGPNRIVIAASDGPTITDTSSFDFFFFEVDDPPPGTDLNRFADYPTLGVDKFALYIGANMFSEDTSFFLDTSAFVIDKADLLASTLTVTAFRGLIGVSDGPYTPQGVHNQDPGATEGYLIGVDFFDFGELSILRISDPGGTPAKTTITVPVNATSFPMFGVPQPSPGPALDDLDDRPFAAMIARNPAGQLRLWTAHNIEVNASGAASSAGGRDGSRWYEIGDLTGTPTVVQSGTVFDGAASQPFSYWMPSIAASGQGHAVMGMSRAGANPAGGHASAAVAERLAGDPAGAFGPPSVVQSSSFLYDTIFPGVERWGDYSQTVVDPNDNMTFWTFQEYANASNSWGVRVVELLAPPPATPSVASPNNVSSGQASVDVDITGTAIDGSGFFDPGPDTGGPGFVEDLEASVDGSVVVNTVTLTDPTHLTLDLDTTSATAGLRTVTITNPDGQSIDACGLFGIGAGPDSNPPNAFGLTTPADGATVTTASPTLSWQAATDAECPLREYELHVDGSLDRDNIDPGTTSATPGAPLSDGAHTWFVRARDHAGNFTDSPSRMLTVDTTVEHPRTLSLNLRKHLRAKGKIVLADGFAGCLSGGEIEIQRKVGGWKTVKRTVTDGSGAYRAKLPDKVGRYRATVGESSIGPDLCEPATSPSKRHRH